MSKNNIILESLILIMLLTGAYLLLKPFYPEIYYQVNKIFFKKENIDISKNIEQVVSKIENINTIKSPKDLNIEASKEIKTEINKIENTAEKNTSNIVSRDASYNILYIPSIDLATDIKELEKLEDLHTGSWRIPYTSNPKDGGNTVIVAHRYTDKGGRAENTFYHLPKVEIGELMYIFWENKKYTYQVYDIKVVEPDNQEVEKATTTANILTLYTCTPLWNSTHRHVVYSKLIEEIVTDNRAQI